ncbi:hypothetical protein PC129_g24121 [Phytophthora cactorum]|uniref:Uncharacterized protein n=1 Tax=Phytophthora cactorum TaxID=29920 RepID=A0A8T1GZG9_9STRA|nr:hypothetical protein PC129_g24121 [Phytophthora cactorum]
MKYLSKSRQLKLVSAPSSLFCPPKSVKVWNTAHGSIAMNNGWG